MANFIALVDPVLERRTQYIETVKPLLKPINGLQVNSCGVNSFHVVWAANHNAPISYVAEEEGTLIIFGEAISQGSNYRQTAVNLRQKLLTKNDDVPFYDGYFAFVGFLPSSGLYVSCDLLGRYPVYYYCFNDVAIIGSSPELFKYHPLFSPRFNPRGLVGILLTNGIFDGQTLWQDVKRLEAGCMLRWQPNKPYEQVRQYQFPHPDEFKEYSNLSFTDQAHLLGETLDDVISRHVVSDKSHSLLLSGGLDSRLLAGFMHEKNIETTAVTWGRRSDVEMDVSQAVSSLLGWKHYRDNVCSRHYLELAETSIKWEHLANGFNRYMIWELSKTLNDLAPKFVAGLSLGLVTGINWPYGKATSEYSFDNYFFNGANLWGLTPGLLKKLLRKQIFGDLVDETLERIKSNYESYSYDEFRRAWWFELLHRQRYHIGSIAWYLSFGAWPVVPILDWELIKLTALLPPETVGDRRAQKEILNRRFPALGQFTLVNNMAKNIGIVLPNDSPPSLQFKVKRKFINQWRSVQEKLGVERRFFCRTYDVNGKGWKKVRNRADSHMDMLYEFMEPEIVNSLIPPSGTKIPCGMNPLESSGLKAVLGFVLWLDNCHKS